MGEKKAYPLRISADVAPSTIAPLATATVTATPTGGSGVANVTVEALGITTGTFDHDDCDAALVCDNAAPFTWDYTAPLQEGTVLFRLTATGTAGERATDFASLNVTSTNQLRVALTADSNVLNTGGMAVLTATATGAVASACEPGAPAAGWPPQPVKPPPKINKAMKMRASFREDWPFRRVRWLMGWTTSRKRAGKAGGKDPHGEREHRTLRGGLSPCRSALPLPPTPKCSTD